jgi:hypothetical protein
MEIGQIAGEITKADIIFPTVKVIQKMSENPNNLDLGTIALNGDVLVANEKGVATLSFLSVKKYYKEILPFGAGMPRIFDSKEEALAAGFRVAASKADRDSGDPLVEDAVQALVAFEKPENRTDLSFPFEVCEKRYMPARWYIESSAYREVAKVLFSAMALQFRSIPLPKVRWFLSTARIDGKKGTYYVPKITPDLSGTYPEEFAKEMAKALEL